MGVIHLLAVGFYRVDDVLSTRSARQCCSSLIDGPGKSKIGGLLVGQTGGHTKDVHQSFFPGWLIPRASPRIDTRQIFKKWKY